MGTARQPKNGHTGERRPTGVALLLIARASDDGDMLDGRGADDRLSEVAVAYVQGRTEAVIDAEDVRGHCRGKIISFTLPRHVVFVDAFSMTESGKIRKAELREDARKRFAERAL